MKSQGKKIKNDLEKLLNLGIGLLRIGEQSFKTSVKSIVESLENIKEKGALDNSKEAQGTRATLEKSIQGIENISNQLQKNLNKINTEIYSVYKKVANPLESALGKEDAEKIKKKLAQIYDKTLAKKQDIQKSAISSIEKRKISAGAKNQSSAKNANKKGSVKKATASKKSSN